MVRFDTLQEIIRTILYKYQTFWYITVRGTPKVSVVVADTFFLYSELVSTKILDTNHYRQYSYPTKSSQ